MFVRRAIVNCCRRSQLNFQFRSYVPSSNPLLSEVPKKHLQVELNDRVFVTAEILPSHLRLAFSRNNKTVSSDFKWFWLRHNCLCFKEEANSHHHQTPCHHPKTRERLLDSSEVSVDIKPQSVEVLQDGRTLRVNWEGNHISDFPLEWLRDNMNENEEIADPKLLQSPINNPSAIEIDYFQLMANLGAKEGTKEYKRLLKKIMIDSGAVLVRNRGLDTEEIIRDLLPYDSDVVSSHFGRIEDLRTDNTTNANNDQLGYTNAAVLAHTDLPFVLKPPTAQALHCITKAESGGDSILVDGFQAALYLKRQDEVSYDLLRKYPVTFHRKQKNYEASLISPIISMGPNEFSPEKFQVRFSYFTMAPHKLPFSLMEPWYRAYNKFTQIVRDPNHSLLISLNPGDYILYNNYRMLHGRTGFSGARWFRGIYFKLDQVYDYLEEKE